MTYNTCTKTFNYCLVIACKLPRFQKADKRHLDGKVNRSLFDSTCDELNKMINDILQKLLGHVSFQSWGVNNASISFRQKILKEQVSSKLFEGYQGKFLVMYGDATTSELM